MPPPADDAPDVSVVVATFKRPDLLARLLIALRRQSFSHEQFEVVVVHEASDAATARVLEREADLPGLELRTVNRDLAGGPAKARDDGWRAARGRLIAFTDDDCRPAPDWIANGAAAAEGHPDAFVQGRTEPDPEDVERVPPWSRPFTRTVKVTDLDPAFQTCNVFYPVSLLRRVDGFDVASFGQPLGGEDSDLAWRAIEAGAPAVFAPDALVFHAVHRLGPWGKLWVAARWTNAMQVFVRHPGLRRALFTHRVFWKGSHYLLVRAGLATLVPRRWRAVRAWLAAPYLVHLIHRGRIEGGGLMLAPYYALHDLIEVITVLRAAIRYRSPML
jgi:GT2 family glycosyltransferase